MPVTTALSFQVGDIVRCVSRDAPGHLTIGRLYKVTDVYRFHGGSALMCSVVDANSGRSHKHGYYQYRFVLA